MSKGFKICFEELEEQLIESNETPEELETINQRLALELEETSNEIEYQSDLVEGLESLRYIASKLDNPTPVQVALFKVAANMAVIGTEQRAQDFIPAMESNKPISLEGFGDKIKEVIKTIIAKLQEWWNKFKDFIKNIFNKEKIVETKAKQIEVEIKEKVKEKAEPMASKIIFTNDKQKVEPIVEEKIEDKDVFLHCSDNLLNTNDYKDQKITLKSINNTLMMTEGLASFVMWTIVPMYINHVERFLKAYKSVTNYNSLIKELDKEKIIRYGIVENIILDGTEYFQKDKVEQNGKIHYNKQDTLSVKIMLLISPDNNYNPFIFQDFIMSSRSVVDVKQQIPSIEELNKVFNEIKSQISSRVEYSVIDKNSKKIESLNKELITFASGLKQESWAKNLDEDYDSGLITISKDIISLCNLLKNVQVFSVKCLDAYYDALNSKTSLYKNLLKNYKSVTIIETEKRIKSVIFSVKDSKSFAEITLINEKINLVKMIKVVKSDRNKGIGKELLKAMTKFVKENNIPLYLEVASTGDMTDDELQAWYSKNGFVVVNYSDLVEIEKEAGINFMSDFVIMKFNN